MNFLSVGDMAQTFQMRRHNVDLQQQLQRLSGELTSGTKSDLAEAVSGDFKALAGIERSLAMLASYRAVGAEVAHLTGSLQTALETAQDMVEEIAPNMLSAASSGDPVLVGTLAADARQKFHAVVATLNVQVADRYLLSGAATDQKPISGSQGILDALMLATAGQTSSAGVVAVVTNWFDAPYGGGGYLDTVYGGSATPLAPFRIGEGDFAQMDVTAADPAMRDLLKSLALGAIMAEGALPAPAGERAALALAAGEGLVTSASGISALRARIGTVEGHLEQSTVRNAAEASALEIARSTIVAADPYETASALEAVQTQIETLYTLTARLSRLSLADYL
ncbi:MAG: flagellar biosynthesis protein FlgL [Rhodobacteraceae bacterium]|nr:flagellar biosynthesis protein FlgL [Paracoccaceae bacterium]